MGGTQTRCAQRPTGAAPKHRARLGWKPGPVIPPRPGRHSARRGRERAEEGVPPTPAQVEAIPHPG